jgi:hypothetical protein
MYIRTECGRIFNNDKINYIFDNKVNIKYETKNHGTDVLRKIKSQGDKLIDVLEDLDLIHNVQSGTVYIFKKWREKVRGLTVEAQERWLHNENLRIVTHEQYMKLAQEIK